MTYNCKDCHQVYDPVWSGYYHPRCMDCTSKRLEAVSTGKRVCHYCDALFAPVKKQDKACNKCYRKRELDPIELHPNNGTTWEERCRCRLCMRNFSSDEGGLTPNGYCSTRCRNIYNTLTDLKGNYILLKVKDKERAKKVREEILAEFGEEVTDWVCGKPFKTPDGNTP